MRKALVAIVLFNLLAVTFPVRADDGMWTFDNPPLRQWKERYNFEPSKEWLDKVRLASPKIGTASGGFVSANGLVPRTTMLQPVTSAGFPQKNAT